MNQVMLSYNEAEKLRKDGQYLEAASGFAELWRQRPGFMIGWRHAYCLRKLGQLDEAEQVIREALQKYPNDTYAASELERILEAKAMKIAEESGTIPRYEQAEDLRVHKKYTEALPLFMSLWEYRSNKMIGWRYAQCLRKVGQFDHAEQIARQSLDQYPDDKFTANELIWVLYERDLKPAKKAKNLSRALSAAREIMKLNPDGLALQKTVVTMMKVIKDQNSVNWNLMLIWAEKISAQDLSCEPLIMANGKKGMSDREVYYLRCAKALLKLKRYDEARQQSLNGLADFPDEFYLARVAALALASSGDVEAGAEELRQLQKHRRCTWYAKAELAKLEHQLGNHQRAYQLICEALSDAHQEDQYKLGHLVTVAQIALDLDKPEIAAEHVALAKAIRSGQDWSIPPKLLQVEKSVSDTFDLKNIHHPVLPEDVNGLSRLCRKRWREGSSVELTRRRGKVKSISPDRDFTFIAPDGGGEDIYVRVSNLPRTSGAGSYVDFALKPSVDKKKGKDSFQAVDVRCI